MIMISEKNREEILASICARRIDTADVGIGHIVDEILLVMSRKGLTDGLSEAFKDLRVRRSVPFALVMLLSIAAKMKVKTSLTDIPFAITDTTMLGELGYAMWDEERALGEAEEALKVIEAEQANRQTAVNQTETDYKRFVGWAEQYRTAALDVKRMILYHLVRRVTVRRGYHITVELTVTAQQFFGEDVEA